MCLDLNYKANILVDTEGMEEAEWLNWRRKGIGGSDVGAILGISPYKTSRDVFYEKQGREPDVKNDSGWVALEVGKRLEDLVAMIFAKKTGFRIWQEKKMFQHPLYPFMLADVDYFYETPDGEIGILECKTANLHGKDKWADDSVPYYYETQCRHYMAVNNLPVAYIACLFSNSENDFLYRRLDRDLDFEESMIEEEELFWENYVKCNEEPPLNGDPDVVLSSLKRYQKWSLPSSNYVFDSECSDDLERILQLRENKAAIDKTSRDIEKEMKALYGKFAVKMGNIWNGTCTGTDGTKYMITYRPSTRLGINRDNLERMRLNDHEIYQKYVTSTETRTFQVRKIE